MPLTPEQEQAVRLISADAELMANPQVKAHIDRIRQTHMVAPAKAEAAKAKAEAARTQGAVSHVNDNPIGTGVMENLPHIAATAGGMMGGRVGGLGGGALGAAAMGYLGNTVRRQYRDRHNMDTLPDMPQTETDKNLDAGVDGALNLVMPYWLRGGVAPLIRTAGGYSPLANKGAAFLGGETPAAMMARKVPQAADVPAPASREILKAAGDVPGLPHHQATTTGLNLLDEKTAAVKVGEAAARARSRIPGIQNEGYDLAEQYRGKKEDLSDMVNSMGSHVDPLTGKRFSPPREALNKPMNYEETLPHEPIAAVNETVDQLGIAKKANHKAFSKVLGMGAEAEAMGTATPDGLGAARQAQSGLRNALPTPSRMPWARATAVGTGHMLGGWPLARAAELSVGREPVYSNAGMRKFMYGVAGNAMEGGVSVPANIAKDMSPMATKAQANALLQALQFYPREKLDESDHERLRQLYQSLNQ